MLCYGQWRHPLTLLYSDGIMLIFYFLPGARTGIPIEPQREKRRRRRKEDAMTVTITQSCKTEAKMRERTTSQNIPQREVNTTMDLIQRNIGVRRGKTTERTIFCHPTTPHNQMVQPIATATDSWVNHLTAFQPIFCYRSSLFVKCPLSSPGNGYCQTNGDSHASKATLALWVGAPLMMSPERHQQLQHGASLLGI